MYKKIIKQNKFLKIVENIYPTLTISGKVYQVFRMKVYQFYPG